MFISFGAIIHRKGALVQYMQKKELLSYNVQETRSVFCLPEKYASVLDVKYLQK